MLKLFRHLRPFTTSVVVILLLVAGQALAELYLPSLFADIVNLGVIKGNIPHILRVGGVMLLVTLADAAFAVATAWLSARVSMGFGRDLRKMVFSHVEGFSLHEFDIIGHRRSSRGPTNDITQVQMFTMMLMRMITVDVADHGGRGRHHGVPARCEADLGPGAVVIPVITAVGDSSSWPARHADVPHDRPGSTG